MASANSGSGLAAEELQEPVDPEADSGEDAALTSCLSVDSD